MRGIDRYRVQLWMDIASKMATCENCTRKEIPGIYADATLKAFDKTFNCSLEPDQYVEPLPFDGVRDW